jgi:hypothetical protein
LVVVGEVGDGERFAKEVSIWVGTWKWRVDLRMWWRGGGRNRGAGKGGEKGVGWKGKEE